MYRLTVVHSCVNVIVIAFNYTSNLKYILFINMKKKTFCTLHKPSWQISCFCENIDSFLSNDKKQRNNLYLRVSKHF